MSKKLYYKLSVTVGDDADVESMEEALQNILLDLYDGHDVSAIRVTKEGSVSENDADLQKLLDNLDTIESKDIRMAIDFIQAQENQNYNDD